MREDILINKIKNLEHSSVVRVKMSFKGTSLKRDYFVFRESLNVLPRFFPYSIEESKTKRNISFYPIPNAEFIESISLIGKCELSFPNINNHFVKYEFRKSTQKTL